MNVAIVKYGAGNVRSVVNALKRVGIEPHITDDIELLQKADRVVFPGQGEARQAMRYLQERGLDKVITGLKQPVLGICIGQQLLCRHSEEGDVDCLGVFDADVVRFQPMKHEDKVPHMGWNTKHNAQCTMHNAQCTMHNAQCTMHNAQCTMHNAQCTMHNSAGSNELLRGVDGEYVYYVHSYYVPVCAETIATTDYIVPFSAAMHKDNFYSTQFHPEKSGRVGEIILRNFLEL